MIWLVVLTCFNHLEKYEFVNGKDAIPYMKWKIKFMFETTNQIQSVIIAMVYNWFYFHSHQFGLWHGDPICKPRSRFGHHE